MKACTAVTMARPAPANCEKALAAAGGAQQQPHGQHAEQQRDQAAEQKAEFLARHREDEVGMRVGDAVFDRAGARPDAGKAAMRESFQRQTRLIAGIGIAEELVHAVMDMREDFIDGNAQHPGDTQPGADPEQSLRRPAALPPEPTRLAGGAVVDLAGLRFPRAGAADAAPQLDRREVGSGTTDVTQ